jgi:hypothetical protein
MDGGKLSGVNAKTVSRRQNELELLALTSDNFPPSIPLATPW